MMNQQIIQTLEELRIKKEEDLLIKLEPLLLSNEYDHLRALLNSFKTSGNGYTELFTYISTLINKYKQYSDLPVKEKTLL